MVHGVEVGGQDGETLERLLHFSERPFDAGEKGVVLDELVGENGGERVGETVGERREGCWVSFFAGDLGGKSRGEILALLHDLLFRRKSTATAGRFLAATCHARLDGENRRKHGFGSLKLMAQVGVLVHAERFGIVDGAHAVDEGADGGDRAHGGDGVVTTGGEAVTFVEDVFVEVDAKNRCEGDTILGICDAATVVDLADDVEERFPRDDVLFLKEDGEPLFGDVEIGVVPFVSDVPAERTKLLAFEDDGVEEAEGVEKLLESKFFCNCCFSTITSKCFSLCEDSIIFSFLDFLETTNHI